MSEQREVTVDSIRDDLRGAIVNLALFAEMYSLQGQERERENGRMSADNLARFGCNCGLITAEEVKEWQGAIHNNNPLLGSLALKYTKKSNAPSESKDEEKT